MKKYIAMILCLILATAYLPCTIAAAEEGETKAIEERLENIIEEAQKALDEIKKGKETTNERTDQDKMDKRLEQPSGN